MADKKKNPRARNRSSSKGGPAPTGPTDVGYMELLARLMAANDLNTVDVRDGDKRVILKRGPQPQQTIVSMPGYAGVPATLSAPAPAPGSGGGTGQSKALAGAGTGVATAAEESPLIPIKSPMVGTFYGSPKPGEKAFVTVGSRVVADETDVCVIEAMKNFFVQKADVTGTIVRILVDNGQPVQVEQPMFLVRPE